MNTLKIGQELEGINGYCDVKIIEITNNLYAVLSNTTKLVYWHTYEGLQERFILPTEPWKPEVGQAYFFVEIADMDAGVVTRLWSDSQYDLARLAIGNCYQTTEIALQAYQRVLTALKIV